SRIRKRPFSATYPRSLWLCGGSTMLHLHIALYSIEKREERADKFQSHPRLLNGNGNSPVTVSQPTFRSKD
ncbi:MAG: hypothetical protein ABW153_18730, partial [Sedimenticola sp.]